MIKLYLARHGETEGNVQQWYQGSTDVPLNEHGLEQARCLGEFFRYVHLDAVYSSTLQRAKVTGECVAAPHHLDVVAYDELKEADFGVWEGHTYQEITTSGQANWKRSMRRTGPCRPGAANRSARSGTGH